MSRPRLLKEGNSMTILEILEGAVARSASDILIIAGMPNNKTFIFRIY